MCAFESDKPTCQTIRTKSSLKAVTGLRYGSAHLYGLDVNARYACLIMTTTTSSGGADVCTDLYPAFIEYTLPTAAALEASRNNNSGSRGGALSLLRALVRARAR